MTQIHANNQINLRQRTVDEYARAQAPNTTPRAPTKMRQAIWWACYLASGLVTLTLLIVVLLRVFYHDGAFPLIWLNAFTRYIYLPAYFCLAWAAWQRRCSLAIASALVVGCHLAWLVPDFMRVGRFEPPATAPAITANADVAQTVRIFFANVRESNEEFAAMLQEISAANPDVIVLVEYGWGWHLAFKQSPVMAPYVHGSGHLQSHIGSVNVFSRLPLKSEVQNWVGGRAMHVIDIVVGDRSLRLIGLHGPRPINLPRYNYNEYWQAQVPLLLAQQGPLVVVGDFNATQHSRVYRDLTVGGLRSAHEDRSRGYASTWPNGKYLVPPIRIDQALLSPEVECLAITEGRGLGSDHKPLMFDVRIRTVAKSAPSRLVHEK